MSKKYFVRPNATTYKDNYLHKHIASKSLVPSLHLFHPALQLHQYCWWLHHQLISHYQWGENTYKQNILTIYKDKNKNIS